MLVAGFDGDFFCSLQGRNGFQLRQTETVGVLIGEDEQFIVWILADDVVQVFVEVFAQNDFLFAHNARMFKLVLCVAKIGFPFEKCNFARK